MKARKQIKRVALGLLLLLSIVAFNAATDLEDRKLKGPIKSFKFYGYELHKTAAGVVFSLNESDSATYFKNGRREDRPERPDNPNADLSERHPIRDIKIVKKNVDSISNWRYLESMKDGPYHPGNAYSIYNHKGQIVERRHVKTDGQRYIYKYNKEGEMTEWQEYNPVGQKIKYSDKVKFYRLKNGNMKLLVFANDTLREVVWHRRTFDKYGNWTIDSIFANDSLSHLQIRKFEYWPK